MCGRYNEDKNNDLGWAWPSEAAKAATVAFAVAEALMSGEPSTCEDNHDDVDVIIVDDDDNDNDDEYYLDCFVDVLINLSHSI